MYFADCVDKSLQYTMYRGNMQVLALCEVALGRPTETFVRNFSELPEGHHSRIYPAFTNTDVKGFSEYVVFYDRPSGSHPVLRGGSQATVVNKPNRDVLLAMDINCCRWYPRCHSSHVV